MNEVLSVENAAIERLERRISETPIANSKKILEQHLDEEKGQQRRLKDLISSYDKKPIESKADLISLHSLTHAVKDKKDKFNSKKDTNTKKIQSSLHDSTNLIMTDEEREILNTKEDELIKNDEILAYKTILKIAESILDREAINILKQNLHEKELLYDNIKEYDSKMINEIKENNNNGYTESFQIGSAIADMLTSYWNSQENPSKVYLFNRRVHHGTIGALLSLSSIYKKNPLITGILSGLGAGLQKDDSKDSKEWFLFRKKGDET